MLSTDSCSEHHWGSTESHLNFLGRLFRCCGSQMHQRCLAMHDRETFDPKWQWQRAESLGQRALRAMVFLQTTTFYNTFYKTFYKTKNKNCFCTSTVKNYAFTDVHIHSSWNMPNKTVEEQKSIYKIPLGIYNIWTQHKLSTYSC